jgi:flavin reductase (DIM6/NTAB) family NADH-FMN oxidoreductase RutF
MTTDVEVSEFKRAVGSFATGVTVVSFAVEERAHGFTANSFTSVSLAPPLVLVCLHRRAPSVACLRPDDPFAINVLGSDQRELSDRFARPSEDKFAGVGYQLGATGAPVLAECLATIECRLDRWFYGGDHIILLGAVQTVASREGEPLVFHRGQYR